MGSEYACYHPRHRPPTLCATPPCRPTARYIGAVPPIFSFLAELTPRGRLPDGENLPKCRKTCLIEIAAVSLLRTAEERYDYSVNGLTTLRTFTDDFHGDIEKVYKDVPYIHLGVPALALQ